jgi:hypothetical protein
VPAACRRLASASHSSIDFISSSERGCPLRVNLEIALSKISA